MLAGREEGKKEASNCKMEHAIVGLVNFLMSNSIFLCLSVKVYKGLTCFTVIALYLAIL